MHDSENLHILLAQSDTLVGLTEREEPAFESCTVAFPLTPGGFFFLFIYRPIPRIRLKVRIHQAYKRLRVFVNIYVRIHQEMQNKREKGKDCLSSSPDVHNKHL